MRQITTVVVVLTMAVLSCTQTERPTHAPFHVSIDDAKRVAADEDRNILVKFYADWCSSCRTLDTVVFVDSQIIEYFTNEVVLAKVDTDVDSLLARAYSVSGLPTCVLMDKDGNEIDRIVGYLPTDDFLETVRNYQSGIGTLDDLLQRAETETDRGLYFEIGDKYKYRGGSEKAEEWFNKVIEAGEPRDSLSGKSRLSIADMYFRARENEKALTAFRRIIVDFKSTSFEGDAIIATGHVLRRLDDYPTAISQYEVVMEQFKGEDLAEEAEIYRAIAFRQSGDTATAIQAFTEFMKHYPESEDLGYAERQVKKLKGEGETRTE